MPKPYIYIFIREDMPKEYMIVQACHACLDLPKVPKETHIVLIGLKNQKELLEAAENMDKRGIKFEMFFEPDYETGHSAIATEPIYGAQRNGFKKYKLLRFN